MKAADTHGIVYTPQPIVDFMARSVAAIHAGYEEEPEYPLAKIETPEMPLDWRVEKMRLSKDGTQLRYNGFLTLGGSPGAAFDYRLGSRSALEWVLTSTV